MSCLIETSTLKLERLQKGLEAAKHNSPAAEQSEQSLISA
jgi:hypothetical protein